MKDSSPPQKNWQILYLPTKVAQGQKLIEFQISNIIANDILFAYLLVCLLVLKYFYWQIFLSIFFHKILTEYFFISSLIIRHSSSFLIVVACCCCCCCCWLLLLFGCCLLLLLVISSEQQNLNRYFEKKTLKLTLNARGKQKSIKNRKKFACCCCRCLLLLFVCCCLLLLFVVVDNIYIPIWCYRFDYIRNIT